MVWTLYTESIDAESQQVAAGWGCVTMSPAQEEKIAQGVINFDDDKTYRAGLMALVRALRFVPEGAMAEIVSADAQIIQGLRFRKNFSETNPADDIFSVAWLWRQVYVLVDARQVKIGGEGGGGNHGSAIRARALAQEALDAYASGQMPTSTPTISDYELAGSPGSQTIGCGGWLTILIVGSVVGAVVGVLKWIFNL